MKKYAIRHKEGFLVRSLGDFIGISTSFGTAMTFSSKKSAEETAKFLNELVYRNGSKSKDFYSVCERSQYVKPAWAKKIKK